jgi:hypothetical protein
MAPSTDLELQVVIDRLDGRRSERLVLGASSVWTVLPYLFERIGWQSVTLRRAYGPVDRVARIRINASCRRPQLVLDVEGTRSVSDPSIQVRHLAAAAVAFLYSERIPHRVRLHPARRDAAGGSGTRPYLRVACLDCGELAYRCGIHRICLRCAIDPDRRVIRTRRESEPPTWRRLLVLRLDPILRRLGS